MSVCKELFNAALPLSYSFFVSRVLNLLIRLCKELLYAVLIFVVVFFVSRVFLSRHMIVHCGEALPTTPRRRDRNVLKSDATGRTQRQRQSAHPTLTHPLNSAGTRDRSRTRHMLDPTQTDLATFKITDGHILRGEIKTCR